MTLNGVVVLILRYFTECSGGRKSHLVDDVTSWPQDHGYVLNSRLIAFFTNYALNALIKALD